ncbi:MAG TPA: hypothetical protein VFT70_18730 [Nocardioides sp.]|nr:hypothetical protein [Nocardioides sp.]
MTEWFDDGVCAYAATYIADVFFRRPARSRRSTIVLVCELLLSDAGTPASRSPTTSRRQRSAAVALAFVPETARASIRGTGVPGVDTRPAPV